MQITIDGPAGAGKTTTAKALAKILGFIYVDTGALYRAIALYLIRNKIPLEQAPTHMSEINLRLTPTGNVRLNGEDVSQYIRTQEISKAASDVSAIPEVRKAILSTQRDIAAANDVVMEGRDIGSVILPDADVKFYLSATLEERAGRRFKDYAATGGRDDLSEVTKQLAERDHNDMTRKHAPLVIPDGAVIIDNTDIDMDQTIATMLRIVNSRRNGGT